MNLIFVQSLFFFVSVYLISFLIVLGCDSWFLVWVGLEMNMISFISVIYSRMMLNVESCLKYFFIQSIGSGMFISSFYFDFNFLSFLMVLILSYKGGGGMFYFWFPSLCEGLSWFSCFVLMTLQKVIPLLMISLFLSEVVWVVIMFSMVFGMMGAMGETKLKKLLAYSSVYHLGWLMVCLMLNEYSWYVYFILYFYMMLGVVYLFSNFGVVDLVMLTKFSSSFMMILAVLNMGGMPPMLGFFMKWYVFSFMGEFSILFLLMMVIFSILMFYIYFRMAFIILMGSKEKFVSEFLINISSKFMLEEVYMLGLILGPMVITMMV